MDVVPAYVFSDEYPVPLRGGRRPLVSDAELVALAVAQAAIGINSDRQFLGLTSAAPTCMRDLVRGQRDPHRPGEDRAATHPGADCLGREPDPQCPSGCEG